MKFAGSALVLAFFLISRGAVSTSPFIEPKTEIRTRREREFEATHRPCCGGAQGERHFNELSSGNFGQSATPRGFVEAVGHIHSRQRGQALIEFFMHNAQYLDGNLRNVGGNYR